MKRLTAIVALALVPFAAAAQGASVLATKRPITWGMIFRPAILNAWSD
jgi:hypothetical protein